MPTSAWILVVWLTWAAIYNVYIIDRPREPRTMLEGVFGVAEIAVAIYLVVGLAP